MSSMMTNGPPAEDLNTPAKIRIAAIKCFVELGFQKTSIRGIANAAGVSPGLVIHHFGSKDALRQCCDDFILSKTMARANDESSPQGFRSVLEQHLKNPDDFNLEIGYLRRAVSENSPMGQQFIALVIDETEEIVRAGIADGTMNPSADPRALAVFVAMTSVSMLTMSAYINAALGIEEFSQALTSRMAIPALELFTYGLYTDDSYLKAAQEVLAQNDLEEGKR